MISSECRKGTQVCRCLVGARPDDWWEFEETEINGRSSQLEAEKWIDESVDSVLNVIERLWRHRFPGAPVKRGICEFRLSESSRPRPRAPSRKLDPTGL